MAAHSQRRTIVLAVQGVLVVLIALLIAVGVNAMVGRQLADSTWQGGPAAPEAGSEDGALAAAEAPNVMRYNRNLFNQNGESESAAAAPAAPSGASEPVEDGEVLVGADGAGPGETDLQHTLLGTMVASDPRASVAHVRTAQGEDIYARVGDSLPSCAILEIGREYILVERTDRFGEVEFLSLYGKGGSAGSRFSEKATASRRATLAKTQRPKVEPKLAAQPVNLTGGRGTINIPSGMVSRGNGGVVKIDPEVLERQNRTGAPLAETMKLEAMVDGGNVVGMRVGRVDDNSLFSQMGMAEGDVITSVNGVPASDDRVAGGFLHSLENDGKVTVEVDRRGQKETLILEAR